MANKLTQFFKDIWQQPPVGNVLAGTSTQTIINQHIPTQKEVQSQEPYGSVPRRLLGRSTGFSQIQNLTQTLDVTKVQNALRQAERGDTSQLFTYYRDLFLGNSAVASELSKRKLATLSEPFSILPIDKENADDVLAAKVIENMILSCPNWDQSLVHLMNAIIYPIAVCEKLFEPWNEAKDGKNEFGIRYKLKKMEPVDYNLITYRLPYLPTGPLTAMPYAIQPMPSITNNYNNSRPEATVYDPDSYEPDLRFWSVLENGIIIKDMSQLYQPDPERHFIYRCNLLDGLARENFGGLGRAILFWAIMQGMGRDFFVRLMDRYGVPFPVAHVDTSQEDTVKFLEEAFQLSQKIGGLIVNKDAQVEIQEINMAGGAEAHEKYMNLCNDQIALLISGQTLSSHAKSTGLGSGTANLQSQVRQDIIRYDRQMLGTALRDQLFRQYLQYNGFQGQPPKIVWGSADSNDAKLIADTLAQLNVAGLSPSDDDLQLISNKLGFQVMRIEVESPDATGGKQANKEKEVKKNEDKAEPVGKE